MLRDGKIRSDEVNNDIKDAAAKLATIPVNVDD